MNYEFHPEALVEFEEAARYYESRQGELGTRFIEVIEEAFREICAAPARWRIFEEDVRRYLVHVFPFAVLYSVERDYVLIIAVMHCSREPSYWKHRIAR
jgi:toxin ParE1/3/4